MDKFLAAVIAAGVMKIYPHLAPSYCGAVCK